jgi:hypothetical protein
LFWRIFGLEKTTFLSEFARHLVKQPAAPGKKIKLAIVEKRDWENRNR